jgi:flavin-dependent dehydrogenase
MSRYDVIVVGAGPSGSTAAKVLSSFGHKVLLIDKKRFPRVKSCCGFLSDQVFADISRLFGEIPNTLFCRNKTIRFLSTYTGINYNEVKGYDPFINTYRNLLDEWLARSSGAEFLDTCEAVDISEEPSRCTVACKINNVVRCFECRYVICTSGANSRFRRKFDSSYKAKFTGKSIQNIYEGSLELDNRYYYVTVNKKFTDSAFSYCYFKDSLIHVGSAWVGENWGYIDSWYSFLCTKNGLKAELIRSERCCAEHSLGTNALFFGNGKILFAGEAAGLMENWGIGIPIAVRSGEIAAKAIIQNVQNEDLVNKYKQMLNVVAPETAVQKTLF